MTSLSLKITFSIRLRAKRVTNGYEVTMTFYQWIAAVPPALSITSLVVFIIAIVIIALYGRAKFSWGQKNIEIGRENEHEENQRILRSCGDCRKILMGIERKYNMLKCDTESGVLRKQMNYAEQRIQELELRWVRRYREGILSARLPGTKHDYIREQKEYLLYQETLSKSLILVQNEIRRSFKQNGFHEKSGNEFSSYIKTKSQTVLTIIKEYIMSRYPFENMILPLQDTFDEIDYPYFEGVMFEVFTEAKEIMIKAEAILANLNIQCELEISGAVKL